MKTVLLLSFLLCSSSVFAMEFKTVSQAEEKLASYTVETIKEDEQRYNEGKTLKINELFEDLKALDILMKKNKMTEELAVQIERVCLIASLRDKSNYAIDLILPLYQKNKTLFKRGLQRFHPVDQKELKDTLDGKDQEYNLGNG